MRVVFSKYFLPLTLALALLAQACSKKEQAPAFSETERETYDSIARQARSITDAQRLVDSYRQSGNTLGQIVALRQLGKLYREDSQFMKAIECHSQGMQMATNTADTIEIIQALNSIGTNYRRMGSLEEAAASHQQAINMTAAMHDKSSLKARKNQVVSLNGMGNVMMALGYLQQADSFFRLALQGEKALDSKLGQAINLANIGSIKEQLNQADSAWIYYQQSLKMNEQAESMLGVALCHKHFGELYENSGQPSKAIEEYQTAYDLLQAIKDDWHWLDAALSMANINISLGKTESAMAVLEKADDTAKRIGSQDHRVKIHELYYQLYEATGNPRLALDNYVASISLRDSLMNNNKLTNIQDQRLAYERSQRQKELQTLKDELQQERSELSTMLTVIIIIAAVALALLALMWLSIRKYKSRLRRGEMVLKQREEQLDDLAQEFHTPLAAILAKAQQLQNADSPESEKVHQAANTIARQGDALLRVIARISEKTNHKA